MATGPYSQDLLTRIYNVQWGGGVFIAGDLASNIYYLKPGEEAKPGETSPWKNLGQLEFHKESEDGFTTGRVAGSAYAMVDVKEPVFVLVGGSGFTGEIGIIMASNDGLSWEKVFTFKGNPDPEKFKSAGIFAVVWNAAAKMFYAGGHQTDNFADPSSGFSWTAEYDILLQSSDGYSWTEASRHTAWYAETTFPTPMPQPGSDIYKTGLLVPKCRNLVKDSNGNNIPDGNYGYNGELLIAPASVSKIDYLYGNYLNDIPQGSTVTISGEGTYPSNVGIPVTCVGTVGGKWVAAGGVINGSPEAAILTSSEDGLVWKSVNPSGGSGAIVTLIGGAANAGL